MIDNKLDDLIIDTPPQNDQSKLKGLLIILVLILIVLVFAIIFTKTVLEDSSSAKAELEDSHITFHQSDDLVTKDSSEITTIKPKIKAEVAEIKEEVKLVKKETINITEESLPHTEKPVDQPKTEKKEETSKKEAVQAEPKKEVVAEESKATPTPTPSNGQKQFFIQVGYFAKTPSKRFIDVVEEQNFKYVLEPYGNGNSKKFLIGPYTMETKAREDLVKIRKTINQKAFVITK